MANGQQGHPAGRAIGFAIALGVGVALLAALVDRASIAMGGRPVAMCAFILVIRELGGTAIALFVFVAGLVLLALAAGRSRLGAMLLLAGSALAIAPDVATGLLDPASSCATPVATPAPPASVSPPSKPLQPRTVLTPL